MGNKRKKDKSVVAENRKARHLYFLSDFMVAGLVLTGTEIKSIRAGSASLVDSYVYIRNGEAFVANMHIAAYKQGTIYNVDPLRDRKLLLHKQEIAKLNRHIADKGSSTTCVPTKLFFSNGYAKLEIALAIGKKDYDKRESIKERDDKRYMDKALKDSRRSKDE